MEKTWVLVFDKENSQKEYQFIARDKEGKLGVGWIVIEQPWYSNKSNWTYWMYTNQYAGGHFCGGAADLGLERTVVNPETIRPFNQIENIKLALEEGFTVELKKKICFGDETEDNILAIIRNAEEIPYELWRKNGEMGE